MSARRFRLHDPEAAARALARADNLRALSASFIIEAGRGAAGERHWYVLQVEAGHEAAVEWLLDDHDIHNWIPRGEGGPRRLRGRPLPTRKEPAFPGYVFVRVVPGAACFIALTGLKHVTGILSDGDRPVPVNASEIEALQGMERDGRFDADAEGTIGGLRRGDAVQITAGPFAQVEAVVLKRVNGSKVKLDAMLFGALVPMTVPLAIVERIA